MLNIASVIKNNLFIFLPFLFLLGVILVCVLLSFNLFTFQTPTLINNSKFLIATLRLILTVQSYGDFQLQPNNF